MSGRTKIICVVGPTASGKTELAARLALALGGEVVGADSMQIYRGLSVGTAKPSPDEMLGVPHHMLDVAKPGERYSVARYVEEAGRTVDEISARGRVPVVAGGTGLYISSLVRGFQFETGEKCDIMECEKDYSSVPQPKKELRERLDALYGRFGGEKMMRLLERRDPFAAARIHQNDRKRLVRALEYSFSGVKKSEADTASRLRGPRYDALWIGLDYRDRALLYKRVDRRADMMIVGGALDEARRLRGMGGTAAQAIGYKELYGALDDPALLPECAERMKRASRRYAKRQLTWFRAQEGVRWFFRDEQSMSEILRESTEYAKAFLYNDTHKSE